MKAFLETFRARLGDVYDVTTDHRIKGELGALLDAIDEQIPAATEYDQLGRTKDQQISKLQADVNLCLDALRESGNGSLWAVREVTGEEVGRQTTTDLPALAERIMRIS